MRLPGISFWAHYLFEELNEVVEAITDGVERPDNRPVC
jgi:hypothetical protein